MKDFRAKALASEGVHPISFDPPKPAPGLKGCTGVAGLGICICCDRLYIGGTQMTIEAQRRDDGSRWCPNQVVGGVHVTSIPRESGAAQTVKQGGDVVTTPANGG